MVHKGAMLSNYLILLLHRGQEVVYCMYCSEFNPSIPFAKEIYRQPTVWRKGLVYTPAEYK